MVSPCPSKKKNDEFAESDLKKKLVPGEKPLLNHKFYLDLKNRPVATKLETQIKELGGNTELFLVKEVTHVITDRESWQNNKRQPPTYPNTNDSPRPDRSARPKTRADAMLERARSQTTGIVNDPLDDAKRWGISVWSVEKALAWLDQVGKQFTDLKKKVKVFPLKEPYIKFETFDKKFRPVFKEIPVWPIINLGGKKGDPAFICKAKSRRNMTRKTRLNHQREDTFRPGYCEVCRIEYSHLEKHQKSEKHQKFISDNGNFIGLDTLINDGSNIESFLKLHATEDKMCDSDPEYNLPKRLRRPKQNTSSFGDGEKLKTLTFTPTNEMGGHRLRSRTQVNYVISTPTEDEFPQTPETPVKDIRELRSSSRLFSKAVEKVKQEHAKDTWDSGRPKRSCILNKKRFSAEGRLITDNRAYYKVEVMLNKLRSGSLTTREQELLKRPRSPTPDKKSKESEDDKGLIVKFRRIRNSELTYLNNEAENFLFPKKEESSEDDPDADGPNTTVSSTRQDSSLLLSSEADDNDKVDQNKETSHRKRTNRIKIEDESAMDGFSNEISTPKRKARNECKSRLTKIKMEDEASIESSFSETSIPRRKILSKDITTDDGSMDSTCSESKKKRRRTHAEAFIMDNQKYYKFETPGSRLRYQGSFLPPVTAASKTSPTKNNGDCTLNGEQCGDVLKKHINLNELQYSFEMVPEKEPWYEAFRRQDTGQVTYLPISSDLDCTNSFLLPYQLPPLPPLDPKICIAAYKVRKKLPEPASTSHGEELCCPSSEGESSAVIDEDSKASTSASEDVQAELLKVTEVPVRTSKSKRRYIPQGRNPRKSPRQHASTLAILSSLVHHRKKRGDLNRSRGSSDLNDSRQKLPIIAETEENEVNYHEMQRDIEKMFEAEDDKFLQDLEAVSERSGVDIHCVPDAIGALQVYDQLKATEHLKKNSKRLLNGSALRKPGRKKKTNKTGWPNRNRRNAFRNRETNSTKDEDEIQQLDCDTSVKSDDLDKWKDTEKEIVTKINNCELQPFVRVQKLDSEVIVRHKRSCSVDTSPINTEKHAKRTQSSPKSPRALRKPRGRWYKER